MKTGVFSSSQPTQQQQQQQTPPGNTIPTGPALPQQHLTVHPYSQPTLPLGPFANMIGYPFLPQSYTYMPSGFQQAFAGNSTYHQQLAAVLPQYKNSVSVSSLPQSAAVPSGYGSFGNSTAIPGNYQVNQAAGPAGSTLSYDDVLNAHYKENSQLLSLQQVFISLLQFFLPCFCLKRRKRPYNLCTCIFSERQLGNVGAWGRVPDHVSCPRQHILQFPGSKPAANGIPASSAAAIPDIRWCRLKLPKLLPLPGGDLAGAPAPAKPA